MTYFKINDVDFSHLVSALKVSSEAHYNAQTNAAGNTVVDFINIKRKIEVGIIPMDDAKLLGFLRGFTDLKVSISFRNPDTNTLDTIDAIIPSYNIEYYTIQNGNVLYKAATLTFIEL